MSDNTILNHINELVDEEKRLRSESYQSQLANALMRGINQYFAKNPPLARNRSI